MDQSSSSDDDNVDDAGEASGGKSDIGAASVGDAQEDAEMQRRQLSFNSYGIVVDGHHMWSKLLPPPAELARNYMMHVDGNIVCELCGAVIPPSNFPEHDAAKVAVAHQRTTGTTCGGKRKRKATAKVDV